MFPFQYKLCLIMIALAIIPLSNNNFVLSKVIGDIWECGEYIRLSKNKMSSQVLNEPTVMADLSGTKNKGVCCCVHILELTIIVFYRGNFLVNIVQSCGARIMCEMNSLKTVYQITFAHM